jgi:predicted permease
MWLDHLRQDLRGAVRGLTRYPIAALVAVVSLGGGIGATTATLVVRDVVFHKPPVLYRSPEQLSAVQVGTPERPIMPLGSPVPGPLFAIWRDSIPPSFGTLAASTGEKSLQVRTEERDEAVRIRSVTPEFFAVLGVEVVAGRTFTESIDPKSAILSYRVWQFLFEGRPDAIGRVIWIDNQPHTIVGVMPERFWFSSMNSAIWTPLDRSSFQRENAVEVVVRRPPGVTPEQLAERLQPGLVEYAQRLPAGERELRLKVSRVEGTPMGKAVAAVLPWLLGASVLLTLLIACANVAILVLAQWTAREQEIAVRASLGASRGRIVRALLTESVLLASMGGALGVAATLALRGFIVLRAGPFVSFFDLSIDPRIFVAAALITLATGVVSGVGPALLETRRLHGNPMHTIGSSDRVRQRWRHTLVVMEIAVTVALLVVTATMLDSYRRSLTMDVGYRTKPLLTMRVENSAGVPAPRIVDVLTHLPGVAAAAASTSVPYSEYGPLQPVSSDASGSNPIKAERALVGPEFFATLDVPIRAGRGFTYQDLPTSRVVITNETLARRLFRAGDAIGERLWIGETSYEIIGIVADYINAAFQGDDWMPKLYLPLTETRANLTRLPFLIRASGDPAVVARTLRRDVQAALPGNLVIYTTTIDRIIGIGGQELLVGTAPLAPLIATGMLLTAAGIYGVLAFAITRRSKELAVRVAIGATGRDLVWLVTSHTLRLVAIGTVLGIGITYGLMRVMRAAGGGGSVFDPRWPAFATPVLVVIVIGFLATWMPSRRVLKLNPAMLLRTL